MATKRSTPKPDENNGRAKKTEDAGDLPRVLQFMQLLWGISHGLQSMSKQMESALGVTGPQRLALRIVGKRPGIAPGELAQIMRLHPSTLTGIIRRLEERKLVERDSDPEDARRYRLKLSRDGEKLDDARGGTVEGVVQKALRKLTDADITKVEEVLKSIGAELEQEGNPNKEAAPAKPAKKVARKKAGRKKA